MLVPADLSLSRAEDGVALGDGRLVVSDQVDGLRVIEPDGQSRPFGDLPGAGYVNDPPHRHGAPNGVSLEPDGTHLLVADVVGGEIYRVELASGATELVYAHPYGVNSVVRDSTGAIWFTQSARNTEDQGELGVFDAVDVPVPDGALWRLSFQGGQFADEPVLMVGELFFANGLAIDESRDELFLCELAANRVWSFPVDVEAGTLGRGAILLEMQTPDNVELDVDGRLWIASPIRNEVLVVDPDTGSAYPALQQRSAAQTELAEEWDRRGAAGSARLDLLGPALFEPLPGFVTGVVLGGRGGSVYVSGLGKALIRLDPTPMSPNQLEDFATRYAAAWSSQDPARLASFYARGGSLVVNDGPPSTGRDAIAAKALAFMQAFPDMVVALESVHAQDGRIVFRWIWTGTNTGPGGTGRAVNLRGFEEWNLSTGGKIAESRGYYDEAEYDRQVSGEAR